MLRKKNDTGIWMRLLVTFEKFVSINKGIGRSEWMMWNIISFPFSHHHSHHPSLCLSMVSELGILALFLLQVHTSFHAATRLSVAWERTSKSQTWYINYLEKYWLQSSWNVPWNLRNPAPSEFTSHLGKASIGSSVGLGSATQSRMNLTEVLSSPQCGSKLAMVLMSKSAESRNPGWRPSCGLNRQDLGQAWKWCILCHFSNIPLARMESHGGT